MISAAPLASDSLALSLLGAAHVLAAVRGGRSLGDALEQLRADSAATYNMGAVQDLCYFALRSRGKADAIVAYLAKRVPEPPLLRELLVLSVALLDPTESAPQYSAFVVVDQAVSAAKARRDTEKASGLVNAVLRNMLREPDWQSVMARDVVARTNYPAWWVRRVEKAYGSQAEAILDAGNLPGPLTLRVNQRRGQTKDYCAALLDAGIEAHQIGPSAVRLARPRPVSDIPGFAQGVVSVQDEAAQRAALLLDLADGQRVLDACAAPGGKTGHALELADVRMTALDVDSKRMRRVADNLGRLGLSAQLVIGDAADTDSWWDGEPFERILADLPCTASGIVRRHPDIRWLRREQDIAALSHNQQHILDALWRLVAPNGKLLFVTCSIFPDESVLQAQGFAARHGDAVALAAPGQLLPTAGTELDHDGLFYALFQKTV
jgi:16S rRNA (cytosine967-C5)-methyltransferase